MSEQTDTPDETEQGSVPDASSPAPWGDNFDAGRAWNTITHLRDREKELEPSHKAIERLRQGEDLDTFREIAAAHGWTIPEEVEEEQGQQDFLDEEDPYAPKIGELRSEIDPIKEWVQEQQVEQALGAFNTHLDKLAGDDFELDEDDRSFLLAASVQGGFNEKATEAAFTKYKAALERRAQGAQQTYKESKKAPHVTSAGKPGTEVPSLDTHKDRMEFYRGRMRSAE